MNDAQPASPPRPITSQIHRFRNLVSELHAGVDSIKSRLGPILDEELKSATSGDLVGKPPQPIRVDTQLGDLNSQLENAIARLSAIRDRVMV